MNSIKIYRKNVYGNQLTYIEDNSQEAEAVKRLIKQKTLNTNDKISLEILGVKFEEVLPPKQ